MRMDVWSLTKRVCGCVFLASTACCDTAPGSLESANGQAGAAGASVLPQAGTGKQSTATGMAGRAGTRSNTPSEMAGRTGASMTGSSGRAAAGASATGEKPLPDKQARHKRVAVQQVSRGQHANKVQRASRFCS